MTHPAVSATATAASLPLPAWANVAQAALVLVVLVGATVWPHPGKPALLIPIIGQDTGSTARLARQNGALLLGAGALPGSLTVYVTNHRLVLAAARHGALLLAVPAVLCGDRTSRLLAKTRLPAKNLSQPSPPKVPSWKN